MIENTLFTINSPYRQPLSINGFHFGDTSRKSVCIIGSLRGNEIQQMYVCGLLVKKLKELESKSHLCDNCGILIVPCANYYSMNIGKRFWTMDNTDINRMFPGYHLGETTQRIADGLFQAIQGYEFGIQLASFYQQGFFLPHVKMMKTDFTDANIMKRFGLQYGIIRNPRPYDTTTLNYNWQIWETKAFSLYANSTDTIDEKSAQDAVSAILRFLYESNIITAKILGGYNTIIIDEDKTKQIKSPCGGLFRPILQVGDIVEKHQKIGEIINPINAEIKAEIFSKNSGTVYFCYNNPLVLEHTVLYKIIEEDI